VIQQNLKTCFDNLVKLDIQELDIIAMFSNEGERVPFAKVQKARGLVEQWLDSVQGAMRETLYRLMKQGLNDYANSERKQWVLTHIGQVVATIAQISWCSTSEYYINEMSNNPFALQEWYDMNESQLTQLTDLVRGKLTSLQRKIIVALITTDVHARDIIEDLVKSNVSSIYDFSW
jgi:dynein heavy chain